MGYSTDRARYEFALAAAHKQLHRAEGLADALHDDSARADIGSMLHTLSALADDSISGRTRRSTRVQRQAPLTPTPRP